MVLTIQDFQASDHMSVDMMEQPGRLLLILSSPLPMHVSQSMSDLHLTLIRTVRYEPPTREVPSWFSCRFYVDIEVLSFLLRWKSFCIKVILAARLMYMPLKLLLFLTTNLNIVEILMGNCVVKNVSNFCTSATFLLLEIYLIKNTHLQ